MNYPQLGRFLLRSTWFRNKKFIQMNPRSKWFLYQFTYDYKGGEEGRFISLMLKKGLFISIRSAITSLGLNLRAWYLVEWMI